MEPQVHLEILEKMVELILFVWWALKDKRAFLVRLDQRGLLENRDPQGLLDQHHLDLKGLQDLKGTKVILVNLVKMEIQANQVQEVPGDLKARRENHVKCVQ